jgi:dienelactone hydrolase
VTVLKGEGTHNILYGTSSINLGTRSVPVYLARPDKRGVFPTVVVSHDGTGLASWLKDFARKLARHGLSVVIPDLYRGDVESPWPSLDRAVRSLRDGYEFAESDDVPWASSERLVMVGFGEGGAAAAAFALHEPDVDGLILIGVPGDSEMDLAHTPVSMLGIFPSDIPTPEAVPHMEIVTYGGVEGRFFDDDDQDFDRPASLDAVERVIAFVGGASSGGG